MIVTNTNSTWPSRTSIIPGPRQRARKPTVSSSACIRQCSTSSIASPSARRSIRPSPTCRPTLTPGWSNTTNSGPTRADTASAKHHFKPSLTPSQSPRKNPSSISRLNSLQPHDRRPASSCRPSDQVQTFTLEQQQPDHKAGLDAGSAVVAVERRDLAVYPGPVDLAGKLHQLVIQIDDLVEPGPEQIALSCCRALLGSHCHPPLRSESRMDSQENRQKRNRKIPPPHDVASCDSKSASSAKTDSRSTPYEFFTGDSIASWISSLPWQPDDGAP